MGERRGQKELARTKRAKKRIQNQRSRQNRMGMLCVSGIVLFLVATMSVQIVRLQRKNVDYRAREQELTEQLASEQERQEDIQSYGEYVTTPEYIEQMAKTKLGLVYPNEIIFKEKKAGE